MFCTNSPIGSQNFSVAHQFAICQRLKEKQNEGPKINNEKQDNFLEIAANKAFFLEDISDESILKMDTKNKNENNN